MKGIELIKAERKRQIEKEGFDAHHDWHHTPDELATAGAIYAMPEKYRQGYLLSKWPWEMEWYKPCPDDRIRELVKAGALIAAEIDYQVSLKEFEEWRKKEKDNPNHPKAYKCVRDKDGKILPWVPREGNIGDNHYHFEDVTDEEYEQWKLEYIMTGKCNHPCGHDEPAAYMERSVCDICGDSDLF